MLSGAEQFSASTAELTPNERRLGLSHIVNLYEAWRKPEQMAHWQKKLDALTPAGRSLMPQAP
jgi:hypothetical protein